jgi:hypothetical protein
MSVIVPGRSCQPAVTQEERSLLDGKADYRYCCIPAVVTLLLSSLVARDGYLDSFLAKGLIYGRYALQEVKDSALASYQVNSSCIRSSLLSFSM